MNLDQHYNNLWNSSLKKIKAGEFQYDHSIDSTDDDRRGITLLIRPTKEIRQKIQEFLGQLKSVVPDQYYYPSSDIHMTVMSIISCYSGFGLDQIDTGPYIGLITECLREVESFKVNFRGVTASPSGVMIKGFSENEELDRLRNLLRRCFKSSPLEQSLDKRYAIQTAHLTVMRFKNKIRNPEQLIDVLNKYNSFEFGDFKVGNYELVFNDWYQRRENVQRLKIWNTV